jgi:hypothetical protein
MGKIFTEAKIDQNDHLTFYQKFLSFNKDQN